MSQRSVEQMIGRLVSDEDSRRVFEAGREAVLDEMISTDLWLTPVEHRALLDLELTAFRRLASRLDPRLRKVSPRSDQRDISFGV